MSVLAIVLIVIAALLGVIIMFVIGSYNGLVTLRNRVEEAWSDITVQLKRRTDLIPNLVNSVKGYATHEKEVFEKVTEARSAIMNAQGAADTAKAENMMEGVLKSLFAVAEAYPELKANQNFLQLQQELVDTEDKIQAARRFYNGGVRDLNTKIQTFPANIVAGMFGFQAKEFFDVEDRASVENPVEVKF
ncbi:membrane protein [Candidatus Nanosynbacter lyticus]|uniref:Membrane protein n=1 Tax=Candidatus Nanosynbacter lyticus TaxID=2093824 RepID=A0A6S4GTW3_9BACT|nr:LemA family protein [Candidatus Nanosynbacter lyticus]AJA06561.1 membrane protein [Candidatus Nanosynbacter lyticus]QCT41663.1 LemA family protein [TM7 phylum sp. oral taxon 952]